MPGVITPKTAMFLALRKWGHFVATISGGAKLEVGLKSLDVKLKDTIGIFIAHSETGK